MTSYNIMIVTFDDHYAVKGVMRRLVDAGVNVERFSVVARDDPNCQTDQCDTRGTFWGDLSDVLSDRVVLTLPAIGLVVVLGHVVTTLVSVNETMPDRQVGNGGLSALGTAFFHYGLPKDSAADCEAAVSANRLLVIGYGTEKEMEHAAAILVKAAVSPGIVMHEGV
ncbi:hypothetical protein SAMN05444172_9240 [Burkholderia sp. GAS332]|nr:hypothetical protein SAMN05444172_9240 [Burkholderia sp. GAS332]